LIGRRGGVRAAFTHHIAVSVKNAQNPENRTREIAAIAHLTVASGAQVELISCLSESGGVNWAAGDAVEIWVER
jgi:hypothetical protein